MTIHKDFQEMYNLIKKAKKISDKLIDSGIDVPYEITDEFNFGFRGTLINVLKYYSDKDNLIEDNIIKG